LLELRTVTVRARQREWGGYSGYSGYFADPDGYRPEIAYDPAPIGESVV
jgi:hypothetical protein